MFAQAIWLAGICLEGLLVFRIWRARDFRAYPLFFSYVTFVLLQDILRYLVAHLFPAFYSGIYWSTEFMGVFVGCAVVLEFQWIGLAQFPGAAKLARAAISLVFLCTVSKVLLTALQGAHGWSPMLIIQLERDMRLVQAITIFSLLLLFLCYRIPLGRNLRGIILGYGLFLGISIVNLTYLQSFGGEVQFIASQIQSSAYFVALCVWIVFLWSYAPQPSVAGRASRSRYPQIFDETHRRLGGKRAEVRSTLEIP